MHATRSLKPLFGRGVVRVVESLAFGFGVGVGVGVGGSRCKVWGIVAKMGSAYVLAFC